MQKSSYRRSVVWRLVFFGLPVAAFCFMFREVSNWEKPKGGPVALNEEELAPGYQTVAVILAAIGAIPYIGLLLRFWERLLLRDTSIQRRRFFGNRTLHWEDVIEYRDFRNYIHLVPAEESLGLYIDYYVTFNRHKQLARLISRKCQEVDANMMVSRRRRRLVVCDLGVAPTIAFMVASTLLLFFFRQRIVFLGIISGIVLTLVTAWMWVVTRRRPERWKSGGFIYVTLFLLLSILPPAYFAQGITVQGLKKVGAFGIFYLVGLLAGSGATSALLPSRKRTDRQPPARERNRI